MKGTRFRDESGAVAVVVALCVAVFVLFAAVVVDVGYWYNVRRQLQAAVDAGALAGCRELILEKTDGEIWAAVTEYVEHNTVVPADTTITVVPPQAGGDSDIGVDFVKVTVYRDTRSFFGAILGISQTPIFAQARAEIGYALDGRYLVPFGVPIVLTDDDTRVIGRVGMDEADLIQGDPFAGYIDFSPGVVPADNECVSLPLGVDVCNSQGMLVQTDCLADFGRVLVRGPDFPITDVWFEDQWVPSGSSTRLRVDTFAGADRPTGSFNGQALDFQSAGTGQWQAQVTAPSTTDRYAFGAANVQVDYLGQTYAVTEASKNPTAILAVRRASAPIEEIDVSPSMFTYGVDALSVGLEVRLNRYKSSDEYVQYEYELKLQEGQAAETGNFGLVNFNKVSLAPNPPLDEIVGYAEGQQFKSQIEDGFLGTLHVGDCIRPLPGNTTTIVNPNGPLLNRIGRSAYQTGSPFFDWLADGQPSDSRIVHVPMVEQFSDTLTGQAGWFIVVDFGVFFIDSYIEELGTVEAVRGYFIDYVSPSGGVGSSPGPSGLLNCTPHLVAEDVDY